MSKLVDLAGLERFFDNINKLFASKKLEELIPTIRPIATRTSGVYEIPKGTNTRGLGFCLTNFSPSSFYHLSPVPFTGQAATVNQKLSDAGITNPGRTSWFYNDVIFTATDEPTVDSLTIAAIVWDNDSDHDYLVLVDI